MNTKNNTKESEAPKLRLTDRKRAGILAAAVAEFQRNGFEGTSMDRVAAAANASKRTVYNHFKSKDALFSAIIAEVHDRFGEIEDVPYDSEADLETQLVTIGQRTAETTMNEDFISLARVVISRFMQSPEFAAATMKEQDTFHDGLVRWIKAASKDGRLNVKNAEHASIEFIGLIKAFAFWPQMIGSDSPLTKRKLNAVIKSGVAMFLARYAS